MRRQVVVIALAIGASALVASVALAEGWRSAGALITIKLKQQHRSGQSGTATLTQRADGTTIVKLRVTKPVRFPGASQMAHIHDVNCAKYARLKSLAARDRTLVDGLQSVEGGRSTSYVYERLAERTTGQFSINVHATDYPYTTVVCGDIPKS